METQDHKNPIDSGGKDVERTISRRSSSGVGSRSDRSARSEDELFTDTGKDVERTITRRSSSGVGSRSDLSARSEDELFTDAVTEFNEGPAIFRQASGGVIQRFYSMQNENELDDKKPAVENHIGGEDNFLETDLLKDDQLQTFPSMEVEKNKGEAGTESQDLSLASAAVTLEVENSVGRNILHSSELAHDQDIVLERGKESISTKDEPELKTSHSETPKIVADDVCGFEDNNVKFNALDSSERDNIENCNKLDSPINFYSSVLQGDEVNSGDRNISNSQPVEELDPEIGANENVNNLAISNVLPLEQHPEIEVEDLNHVRGKNDSTEDPDSTAKIVEHGDVVFTKTTDSGRLFSEEDSVSSSEAKREEDSGISKTEVLDDVKIKNLEDKLVSSTEEKAQVTIIPVGATMDARKDPSNADSVLSNVEDDAEYFTVVDHDGSKVSEDDLAVKNSAFIKPTPDDVTLQDLEHLHISNDMGNDVNTTLDGAILNGNVTSDRSVVENMSTKMGSYVAVDDSKEPDRITGDNKMDMILDSGDSMVGHSQGESLFTSQDIESSNKNVRKEECVVDNGSGATLKTDELNLTSKVGVDNDAENICCLTEGDRESKQHATVSAIDANVDAVSLADSLDGNWGSISVMSTLSDAPPSADTVSPNHPQSLGGEENPSMVPNPEIQNQQSQNQVSPMPEVGVEQIEHASEIYSSKEQHHLIMNSPFEIAPTPTVGHVANVANKVNKGKEIVADTTNWDSGKQNTPLKTLLGEAAAKSRAESPIHHNQSSTSTSTSVPQRDVIPDDSNLDKTENVIINSDDPETGKEWNSPARYPVKIKSEKRRSKSKTYWAPFLCCSSVNAR